MLNPYVCGKTLRLVYRFSVFVENAIAKLTACLFSMIHCDRSSTVNDCRGLAMLNPYPYRYQPINPTFPTHE
ncbi:hypothetical protein VB638_15485 [Dolichospermum sp. UHCC 0684]|jgi:hypothetical protein|nr:hypothetical protein [Dolichospermum sp.]MEA5530954.1 hypothetical protein [Dolichospermum sp. UHCC 0684]MTJ33665.1 hypothetical protein [Dolichospermum sp. UHCC 0260]